MIDFKITKIKLLLEQCNDKCHNYYYLINGRFYNEDKTAYKKFKFVVWFDIFDVMEYYEINEVTKEDVRDYVEEIEWMPFYNIESFDDEKHLEEFYEECNRTIEDWNSHHANSI